MSTEPGSNIKIMTFWMTWAQRSIFSGLFLEKQIFEHSDLYKLFSPIQGDAKESKNRPENHLEKT